MPPLARFTRVARGWHGVHWGVLSRVGSWLSVVGYRLSVGSDSSSPFPNRYPEPRAPRPDNRQPTTDNRQPTTPKTKKEASPPPHSLLRCVLLTSFPATHVRHDARP